MDEPEAGDAMKLYYHHSVPPNVGDDLNALLWPRLVPGLEQLDAHDWLVGAGTIVDQRIARLPGRKVVLGSGVRCDSGIRRFGDDVHFLGVRGLLSAQWLGLAATDAVGDPGFVVSRWEQGGRPDDSQVGVVPHVHTLTWSGVVPRLRDAGYSVVEPTLPVEAFLRSLRRCTRVFCESLHGAIFAEALRVPWARVRLCAHHYEGAGVAEFKWRDAFSVLGVTPSPINSVGLAPVKRSWPGCRRAVEPLQRALERRLVRLLDRLRDDPAVFHLAPAGRVNACVEATLGRVARLREHETSSLFL